MRCCASPTTSIAADVAPRDARRNEAAEAFAALLVARAFAPLAASLGFYGDVVVGAASRALVHGERGLVAAIERAIALADR